jgi:hypothetical protein
MITHSLDKSIKVDYDMPNEAYHAEKGHVSRSKAHRYRGPTGGRAQRYESEGKSLFSGNAATSFGSIVDAAFEAVVRGVDWKARCVVPPPGVLASDGSRRGNAFKEWRSSLPAGAVECSESDFGKCADMIASLWEHKGAKALMEQVAHSQMSVFWADANGHKRKARADGVTRSGAWFDLKTTSSEWRDLRWSFRRFGYDWQAAWYSDAAVVAGAEPFVFRFIVVQSFAPYDVKVLHLTEDDVQRARVEIDETLFEMSRRAETGVWVPDSYHDEEVLELG